MTGKKRLLIITWISVAAVWAVFGISLLAGAGGTVKLVLLTGAAVSLEAGFWLSAVILGVSIFEGRRHILNTLRTMVRGTHER